MRIYGKHSKEPIDKTMVRIREAADYCSVSPQTIQRWAKSGLVRTTKLGTAQSAPVLYCVADLEKIVFHGLNKPFLEGESCE